MRSLRRWVCWTCWMCWLAVGCAGPAVALAAAEPPALAGRVSRVTDGDSLWMTLAAGPPVEVRLLGIDAPEGCQAGGPQARQALEAMALQRDASLRTQGRDVYGRTLGTLWVDGLNVNQRLVEEGQAWSLRYKWDQGPYVKQERMAKALSRGVFAVGGAVMPRDFRRDHGPCQAGEGPQSAQSAQPAGPTLPPTAAWPAPPQNSPLVTSPTPAAAAYRCDGRTHCSQMGSCAEATFFLKNCPGVQMDGDGNGVPCEKQFCGRP